jgi:hypothetical protein
VEQAVHAPRRGLLALVLGAQLLLVFVFPAQTEESPNGLKKESLRVGFTDRAFLNMNRNDVEASFKAFTESVGRKRGYLIASRTQTFEKPSEFEAAIKARAIDLCIIDTWSFLTMDVRAQAQPFYVSAGQLGVGRRYVVLTHRARALNTLADLRGKSIIEFAVAGANLGPHWLETVLLTNRLGTQATFFGGVETVGKPSTAVLPVFFGKRDACLVDEAGFQVMNELNPQVGRELQVVMTSEPLVDAVICLGTAGWSSERYRHDLIQGLAELHLDPAGQQILTLFKVNQLILFQESQLDTVTRLRRAYDQLQTEIKP